MITNREQLPKYLQKYIVEQDNSRYTPIDQLVWKYVIRQLKKFLGVHGHEVYLKGMDATGITEMQIPRIEDISAKLSQFGWTALPVSGFIPPAAFMELQSLGILPIASDMRSLGHLMYTPAPDIVHEAAGHAPILIDREYSGYLRQYAQVAKKAIISQEDLNIYKAIRELSDLKEDTNSTVEQIHLAEKNLQQANQKISHISEATQLSRMNWWTAEYGLIGSLDQPKIFGAGLLSSVGESKWCLSDKVKKFPLSIKCIDQSYDITEPQPQLYITPDFQTLKKVLHELTEQMAFKIGGLVGLKKAILAKTVNTVELDSGVQISGVHTDPLLAVDQKTVLYLKTTGPTQLALQNRELPGQDKNYHCHGYGTPIGALIEFPNDNPSELSLEAWSKLGLTLNLNEIHETPDFSKKNYVIEFKPRPGTSMTLRYTSNIVVEGEVASCLICNQKLVLLSLTNAKAVYQGKILFDPSWGVYDIIFGKKLASVYAGAADHEKFGEMEDFVAKRVIPPKYSAKDLLLQSLYAKIFELEKAIASKSGLITKTFSIESLQKSFQETLQVLDQQFPKDWLLRLEIFELMTQIENYPELEKQKLLTSLKYLKNSDENLSQLIGDGLDLLGVL